jgi:hypothetical protein
MKIFSEWLKMKESFARSTNEQTIQIENLLKKLEAEHGYKAEFIRDLGYGTFLYSIGGIYYRIRGDGTIM